MGNRFRAEADSARVSPPAENGLADFEASVRRRAETQQLSRRKRGYSFRLGGAVAAAAAIILCMILLIPTASADGDARRLTQIETLTSEEILKARGGFIALRSEIDGIRLRARTMSQQDPTGVPANRARMLIEKADRLDRRLAQMEETVRKAQSRGAGSR